MTDYPAWSQLRLRSRDFLQPWEPTWPPDDLTKSAFRRRLAAYARDIDLDQAYPFFIFRGRDDALLGGVTLSNVRRGVAQMASIGYWIGQPYARRGHMLAAVRTAAPFAFQRLGLHRLEAACIPDNGPSRELLLKAGFRLEGEARAYLKLTASGEIICSSECYRATSFPAANRSARRQSRGVGLGIDAAKSA